MCMAIWPCCTEESAVSEGSVMIVLVVSLVGFIIWDIWLAADRIEGNTISEVVRKVSKPHPMIPFALGVLIGHWYW